MSNGKECDDFEIQLTRRDDGNYDLLARTTIAGDTSGAGSTQQVTFVLPHRDQLAGTVIAMSVARSGSAQPINREVVGDEEPQQAAPNAQQLGTALADALFAGVVGEAYDRAESASKAGGRRLRLTLSLAAAPDLLSLPWEFLYRAPVFLASTTSNPVVRRLNHGDRPRDPSPSSGVRILGVISSPKDEASLNVQQERDNVTAALQPMIATKQVVLDWLPNATLSQLQAQLRDHDYDILHFIGHGSFASNNDSAIYLEDEQGNSVAVDRQGFAQLLHDENSIRLVVLNSCQGARTSLEDAYAGVATTLIQLGIPAVVAMQFKISDPAAIEFSTELYTNLIAKSAPIDAAIAEARKRIFFSEQKGEFATPVLFVRDPSVALFDIRQQESAAVIAEPPVTSPTFTSAAPPSPPPSVPAPAPSVPAPAPNDQGRKEKSGLGLKIFAGVGAAAILFIVLAVVFSGGDDPQSATPSPTAASVAQAGPVTVVRSATPDTTGELGVVDTTPGVEDQPVDGLTLSDEDLASFQNSCIFGADEDACAALAAAGFDATDNYGLGDSLDLTDDLVASDCANGINAGFNAACSEIANRYASEPGDDVIAEEFVLALIDAVSTEGLGADYLADQMAPFLEGTEVTSLEEASYAYSDSGNFQFSLVPTTVWDCLVRQGLVRWCAFSAN